MSFIRSLFTKTTTPEPKTPEAPKPDPESTPAADSGHPVERRTRRRINAREGVRVLIIDDSPTIVAALAKTLRSAGYITLEALDAETGLKVARRDQPELIFLDIVLPGMSGFAALRLMRRDPATQHIPVIMISGNEQAVEQFYANRIGADDFMKKPFSRAEVFARIEPLLDANQVPRRKNAQAEEAPATPAKPAVETPPQRPAPQAAPASAIAPASERPAVAAAAPANPPPLEQPPAAVAAPVMEAAPAPVLVESVVASAPPVAQIAPAAPRPIAPAPAPAGPSSLSPLEARKELTSMGLQYFDQGQFIAAIQRGDKLAFELFVAGNGIDIAAETDGKTPLQVAREHGRTQIFALLRGRLAAANSA